MENKIEARHLNLYYGQKHALKDVNLDIKENNFAFLINPCNLSLFAIEFAPSPCLISKYTISLYLLVGLIINLINALTKIIFAIISKIIKIIAFFIKKFSY